jgi:hypothetical protein
MNAKFVLNESTRSISTLVARLSEDTARVRLQIYQE